MVLGSSLVSLSDGTLPATFEGLKSHIDIKWIKKALGKKGAATVRRRKLPMDVVVWLVIGMALYRDRSIDEMVRRLDLVEPGKDGKPQGITKGAIPQARERVGEKPLEKLFHMTARHWAKESADRHCWRGLMVLGVDGTSLAIPDTPENRSTFSSSNGGAIAAGYPRLRAAALMVLRSHLLWDVAFADWKTGETVLAEEVMKKLPPRSLVILDRYYAHQIFVRPIQEQGQEDEERHWLVRWTKNERWRVWENFGPGDDLVELKSSEKTRERYPEKPTTLARAIRYQKKGFPPGVLVTSLTDPTEYPAEEIIQLYHERWELEMGYDEIKTHTLESMETIRSKTPEGVRQEFWGLLIAYNLVRREMEQMATKWNLPPRRISFRGSLMLVRDLFMWASTASPGSLPKMVERMRLDLRHMILPERRPKRSYPRWVKKAHPKYPHKPGRPV